MLRSWLDRMPTVLGEEGQDIAEYALLLALIAVALVLVIGALAGSIGDIFNAMREALEVNMLAT